MTKDYNILYYSGDNAFSSRIAAYDHALRYTKSDKISAKFSHNGFDLIDWKVEPKEDFESLCVERLKQIRDEQKQLAIFYSGGSDSNHIVALCIKYRIKIDQIWISRDPVFDMKPHPTNWEIDNHAIPYLKSVGLWERTKILDNYTRDDLLNLISLEKDAKLNKVANYDMTCMHWSLLSDNFEIRPIDGATEPRVFFDNKTSKFYTQIWDTDNFYSRSRLNTYHFYTDPLFPKIHVKQCHLIKRYFRENNLKFHPNNDFNEYKKLSIKLTRSLSFDTSSSPFFSKLKFNKSNLPFIKTGDVKTLMFLQYLYNHDIEFLDRYNQYMNQKIVSIPLWRFNQGEMLLQKYLE